MTKQQFQELEYKIADNKLFNKNNKIKLPQNLQESIFRCFRIVEIDNYKLFKNKV